MNEHWESQFLSAYLDNELTKSEKSLVDSHLASCGDCRRDLESLAQAKKQLSTIPRHGMPPELVAALEANMPRSSRWLILKGWIRLPRIWVPAGVIAMAALLLGIWVGFRSRSAQGELPLEALLAAHSRYAAEGLVPQGGLATSNFSAQLAQYRSDEG